MATSDKSQAEIATRQRLPGATTWFNLRASQARRQEVLAGWLMVAPAIILLLTFMAVCHGIWISIHESTADFPQPH